MKSNRSIMFVLIVVILISLACGLFGGGEGGGGDRNETETDVLADEEEKAAAPEYKPGYEPGWRIFSNANFVNGIAVHEGVLWAATEGGVVAWNLNNDQAVKYTPLDGLGHLSTYDVVVCRMPDPRVVVATEMGLSLFDPDSGTWDTTPITPEDSNVATNVIDKLYCDEQNGRLLIGYRGVGILDTASGGWQRYLEEDGLAWNGVDGMTVVGTDVWAVGYKGISVISGQGVQVYNEETGMPDESSDAIVSMADGTVWVASSGGLVRFREGSLKVYDSENTDGLPGSLKALTIASDGTIWAASGSSRFCQFDSAQEICINTYEGNRDYVLNDMTAGDNGEIYYSTYGGGIFAYNGSEWRNLFLKEDQLAGNFVESIAEDQDGNLWVATDKGIQRFDPENLDASWETFTAGENGPPSSWGQGVFVSPTGNIWFAHDSKRASSFDGTTWSRYGEDEGIIGSVNAIAFDKDEIPYIGTSEGLLILGGVSHTLLTDADGLPSKNVRSLFADGDVMWVGTVEGLARLQNGNIETVLDSSSEGLPDDNIAVIRKDSKGSLLLGTSDGLALFDGQQVTTLLEPKSRSGLFGEQIKAVSDIAIDLDGSIWVSTYAGLYHGDGQNWEHFTTAEGMPANNLQSVFVDSLGVVWVGGGYTRSGGGIARYIPGETSGSGVTPPIAEEEDNSSGDQNQPTRPSSGGSVEYDQNTGLPIYIDSEQVYSTDSVLNYWSGADRGSLREFYLAEMPKIGWLLDVDESGNCRDDDRCMGWSTDYNDPENQTFFFLKGEKGYLTLNLIPEGNQVNVIMLISEPAE
jgi:ligand-binding sensor domain-containing protein